ERERELERTRDMLEQSQRLASVGAWEFDATGDGASEAVMTDEVYHILNLPTDTTVTVDDAIAFYHPDDRDAIERAIERAVEEGRSFEFEARVVTAAGNERWVRSIGEPVVEDGAVVAVRGSIQDITEPKTFERELRERERDLAEYKEYTDDILDAIDDVFYVLDADGAFQRWNESFVEATGYGDDEIEGMQAREFFPEDQREAVLSGMENALETGGDRTEAEILTADGERVPYEFSATRVENPDGEVGVAGIGRDITRRKERELALQSLHGTTRGLLGAETEADAAELVVDAAEEVLDVAAAVYLLDEETNRLAPVAHTASFDDCCGDASAVATGGDSPLWRSFVDEAAAVVDDPEGVARAEPFGPDVSEGLVVPMGDHGAFVAATANGGIDPDTRQLVETLVATTEAAFDRVESEASLRERDAELAEQNRRLRRQIQVTDIIRQVDRSLIEANSREEIEATVCDRLADAEDVAFAWIGGFGAGGGLEPQAWAGENVSYLDSVSLTAGGDAPEPSVTAATTEEPAVVRNVVDERQRAPWCRSALARDFHSVLSVPLVYEDYSFGVLAVYADEPDVFGDLERSVFAELGTNIANSINAVETRRALHADTFVELALSVDPGETFFGRLARDADCRVEYAGLAAVSDDETRLFVSADAPADRVASALDDAVAVRDYRRVGDGEEDGDGDGTGTSTFEVTVERDLLPARLVRHGVRPRTVAATADGVDVVVDLPRRVDVREFVEMLRETHPSVELVGQRTVEREATTEREFVASLLDSLTDRQLEVLRTAYLAGFFEWPRRSTGEDVAAMLGITQPTVNRHLRFAQQRLLERLFDEPGASPGFVD
ncbi:MAG: bacterio-opsin activator domain-containing protein, partial [Haloarculaceae archaeon]